MDPLERLQLEITSLPPTGYFCVHYLHPLLWLHLFAWFSAEIYSTSIFCVLSVVLIILQDQLILLAFFSFNFKNIMAFRLPVI